MDNTRTISIGVYSSIVTVNKPEVFQIDVTTTARSLMIHYLQRHKIQLIDPNLISVWRIKSDFEAESGFKITDGLSDRLNAGDLIITPAQLLGEEFHDYYLSFERGVQIRVNVSIDRSKVSCQMMLISALATTNLIINLLQEYLPMTKSSRLSVRHKTGILKGNENLVSLIKHSKSDEFHIDLNRSLQYDNAARREILSRLKSDYGRRSSESVENRIDKLNNNLSRTLYHANQQNHRKLPDLIEVQPLLRRGCIKNPSTSLENNIGQEVHRRSLPLIPFSNEQSAVSVKPTENHAAEDAIKETNKKSKDEFYPPEPMLRTNVLDHVKSSSSATSTNSTSDDNSVTEAITSRESVIPKYDPNPTHQSATTLHQIVKYFDLYSIETFLEPTLPKTRPIEFVERPLKDIINKAEHRPRGPNPVLGCGKSAFKVIESPNDIAKSLVRVVENISIPNINVSKGDIIVDVDCENVLSKTIDYINEKLTSNSVHYIVVAKLKDESKNKEKDEKINNLKLELETLKRKYADLHHVTVDNDQIIKQLTNVLKNQGISGTSLHSSNYSK